MSLTKAMRFILSFELAGFVVVALSIWFDELLDLPHYLFGAPAKAINYHEAIFESAFVLCLGAAVVFISVRLMRRIVQLESFLPICSYCKKIRRPETDPYKQESWCQLEGYINERTGAEFSHGVCPECGRKHLGKYYEGQK